MNNIKKSNHIINSKVNDYLIIGVLCATAFLIIYGHSVLNPLYTDWLMCGGDTTQHYLGWKGYKNSDWFFQLGLENTLAYPNKISVIFTDSISLLAVIFKILAPILPNDFQYMGLWGISCFILHGIFSYRIISYFSKNRVANIISSVLLVIAPVMIWRMYSHTALAGHWLILFALEPIFNSKKYEGKRIYIFSAILGLLVSSIHLYFVPICGIIILGISINEVIKNKSIIRSLGILASYLISVIFTIEILGGFSSGMQLDEEGLWGYSFNLNGFFNAQGWSKIIKDLKLFSSAQYEGFAYLGMGIIILLVISVVLLFVHGNAKDVIKKYRGEIVSLLLVFIISIIVACSPRVTFNDKIIAEWIFPHFITEIWSMFRSTGRFSWNAVYIIMICSCIIVCKYAGKKIAIFIVSLALIIQVYDIFDVLKEKNALFSVKQEYVSIIQDNVVWSTLANDKDIKHIVLFSGDGVNSMTNWALDNGITTNRFYFARDMMGLEEQCTLEALDNISDDSAYIFFSYDKEQCKRYNLHYYLAYGMPEVDGVIVGTVKQYEALYELPEDYFYEE